MGIYASIRKTPLDIFKYGAFYYRAAKPVDLGAVLVQFWCNWGGKDGFCALDGLFLVDSIERVEGNFPHGKDFQSSRPIRSQTLYPLSYGCVVGILYRRAGERQISPVPIEILTGCRVVRG